MSAPWDRRTESPDHSGPWSDLPPPATSPSRREPLLRRPGGAGRQPLVRNWRGLAIIGFLLFIAPPLAGWLSRVVMGMVSGH